MYELDMYWLDIVTKEDKKVSMSKAWVRKTILYVLTDDI